MGMVGYELEEKNVGVWWERAGEVPRKPSSPRGSMGPSREYSG